MLAVILKPFIYALAVVGIIGIGWFGYSSWRQDGADSAKVVTVGPTILQQIRHTQELTLIKQYETVTVNYRETPPGWISWLQKFGVSQEFTMLISGHVSAGIDMSNLSAADTVWVSRDNKHVQITLPAPRILTVTIDTKQSHFVDQYDMCPNIVCSSSDLNAYNKFVEPEAQKRLVAAATEAGILKQAADDAQAYYESLFKAFPGVEEVRVVVRGYAPKD